MNGQTAKNGIALFAAGLGVAELVDGHWIRMIVAGAVAGGVAGWRKSKAGRAAGTS